MGFILSPLRGCGFGLLAFFVCLSALAADPKPADKITYEEHIRPVFREHCFSCHNQNKAKNDLALDSYEKVMAGGASGEVIKPGSLDDSYLWQLVSHSSQPSMPPAQDKMAEAKLALIKRWILAGALKDAGSKVAAAPEPSVKLTAIAGAARPSGPPVLPVNLPQQPSVKVVRPGPVLAIAASPWAPVVALAGQKQITLYHTDSSQLLGLLPFPEGVPHALRFSRSGSLLMAGGGHAAKQGKVAGYDVQSGKRVFAVGDELDAVLAADLDSSHAHVALGGPEKLVRIHAVADGKLVHQIKKHTDWIYAVQYSPDGKLLASGDRSGGLWVWEADSGQEQQALEGHPGSVNDVSWRDDSAVLASGGEDGSIRLWEMKEGKSLKRFTAHPGGVLAVQFAHDGRLVSAGRDRTVKVWSPEGNQVRQFGPLPELALRAVFTHDGGRVIAGDLNGEVYVWSTSDGKEAGRLKTHP